MCPICTTHEETVYKDTSQDYKRIISSKAIFLVNLNIKSSLSIFVILLFKKLEVQISSYGGVLVETSCETGSWIDFGSSLYNYG